MRQSNRANIAGRRGLDFYTEEALARVAQQAVDRTLILFEARRPSAGEMPVVLDHGAKLMEGTAAQAQSDPRVIEAYIGKDAADDAA